MKECWFFDSNGILLYRSTGDVIGNRGATIKINIDDIGLFNSDDNRKVKADVLGLWDGQIEVIYDSSKNVYQGVCCIGFEADEDVNIISLRISYKSRVKYLL